MRLLPLAISLSAFVANVSADYSIKLITHNGMNVTSRALYNTIEIGSKNSYQYWDFHQVLGAKDWIYFGLSDYFIRFREYRTGAIALADNTPSLFRIEKDADATYLITTETDPSGQKLAWTAERNDTNPNGNMIVKLRPYDRGSSQRFDIRDYTVPDD
ncbi:hypothetical protein MferCBS31731_003444 [Microsporum ferrugineum]